MRIALFAHGMMSIGVAPPERWRAILARAHRHGAFLGTQPSAFPVDFAIFAGSHRAFSAPATSRP